jgi:hypothetical protein
MGIKCKETQEYPVEFPEFSGQEPRSLPSKTAVTQGSDIDSEQVNSESEQTANQISHIPHLIIRWPWGTMEFTNNIFIGRDRFFCARNLANKITGYADISRLHAELRFMDDGYYLFDLNSTNGTFVDGVRIPSDHPARLREGSQIRLARYLVATIESIQ